MHHRSLWTAPALVLLAALPAFGGDFAATDDAGPAITLTRSTDRISTRPTLQGLAAIRAGDYQKASLLFNAALKFEPENAHLHFLNGLSYHLLTAQGHRANHELAETAYALALQFAPDHALAAYYSGLLHLENRQYVKAQASLAHALLIERDAPGALPALAVASYYAHDLGMATWAIERVEQTQAADADTLRAGAIIHAAAGHVDQAIARSSQHKRLVSDEAGDYVGRRVRNWLSFHQAQQGRLHRTAGAPLPLPPESLPALSPALAAESLPVTAPLPPSCATGAIARKTQVR